MSIPETHAFKWGYNQTNKTKILMEVISISNENKLPQCGTLTEWIPITKAQRLVPVVWFHSEQKPYMCMGILLPYSEEVWEKLHTMNANDRWEWACQQTNRIEE